jgi:hypothetical protein
VCFGVLRRIAQARGGVTPLDSSDTLAAADTACVSRPKSQVNISIITNNIMYEYADSYTARCARKSRSNNFAQLPRSPFFAS